jgi:hypothetical protein
MSSGEEPQGLRRELRFWEAIALSIAMASPGASARGSRGARG